ncbi:MAG TPA: FecR domain-containing protein [Chthonomonadaceae bacterium]|nr:FecR domain-containing protein [Chthonomonadaceae bacterium]
MFRRHCTHRLAAYCQGELSAKEAQRVTDHLERCPRCRQAHALIRQGHDVAARLPLVSAPDALWDRIAAALPDATPAVAPAAPLPFRFRRRRLRFLAASAALVLLTGSLFVFQKARRPPVTPSGPSWEVARLAGQPLVGDDPITRQGHLRIGQWLETDAASRAELKVADIGKIQVEPNTRLRLENTAANEQRIRIAHGEMHAKVNAPPHVFLVDTPAAKADDLGCAYTMKVDDAGNTILHVTIGLVALTLHGRDVEVPAGAACESRPVVGPGTPYFTDSSPAFQAALSRVDFAPGDAAALPALLTQARLHDTLTLWNLLYRANPAQRAQIVNRMIQLSPLPSGVTRAGVLRLDPKMLTDWKEYLDSYW